MYAAAMRIRVVTLLASTTAFLVCAAPVANAAANPYVTFQKTVPYRIYQPTMTVGLSPNAQQPNLRLPCGPTQPDDMLVQYGKDTTSPNFSLGQGQGLGCQDPPGGFGEGVFATFKAFGQTVKVMTSCEPRNTCKKLTAADLKKSGFTTVNLPNGSKAGTHIEIYSAGLNLTQIKTLVAGLRPVTK
jgi:hypothetical protein